MPHGPANDPAPASPELVPLVRFAVDELVPQVCRAAGEPAGAMLVEFRPLDLTHPLICKAFHETCTVTGWLRASGTRYRRNGDGHRHAAAASKVCMLVTRAVRVWWHGDSDDHVDEVRHLVAEACRQAGPLFDDPATVVRLRLVAAGTDPGAATSAARAALT